MELKELRIGNYVNGIYEHEIDRGNGIIEDVESNEVVKIAGLDSVGFSEYSIWIEDGSREYYDSFEPIPINEEWLIKFKAVKMHANYLGYKYSRFKLIWKESYKYWYVLDWVDETYMTKIEFVHEFQNFIKAMDDEELTIKQ